MWKFALGALALPGLALGDLCYKLKDIIVFNHVQQNVNEVWVVAHNPEFDILEFGVPANTIVRSYADNYQSFLLGPGGGSASVFEPNFLQDAGNAPFICGYAGLEFEGEPLYAGDWARINELVLETKEHCSCNNVAISVLGSVENIKAILGKSSYKVDLRSVSRPESDNPADQNLVRLELDMIDVGNDPQPDNPTRTINLRNYYNMVRFLPPLNEAVSDASILFPSVAGEILFVANPYTFEPGEDDPVNWGTTPTSTGSFTNWAWALFFG